MKKLITICTVVGVIVAASSVPARATYIYTETIELYIYGVSQDIDWVHTYDHSADPVLSASLTIVADDVDAGENDEVYFTDSIGTEHFLGYLEQMDFYTDWDYWPGPGNPPHPNAITETVFTLDPSWLDTTPVQVRIDRGNWGVEIETSTLSVVQVPEPATICLLGLGALSLLRRKRSV
jgi:hypothetical protein